MQDECLDRPQMFYDSSSSQELAIEYECCFCFPWAKQQPLSPAATFEHLRLELSRPLTQHHEEDFERLRRKSSSCQAPGFQPFQMISPLLFPILYFFTTASTA